MSNALVNLGYTLRDEGDLDAAASHFEMQSRFRMPC